MYALGDVPDKLKQAEKTSLAGNVLASVEDRNVPLYIIGSALLVGLIFPMFSKRRGDW